MRHALLPPLTLLLACATSTSADRDVEATDDRALDAPAADTAAPEASDDGSDAATACAARLGWTEPALDSTDLPTTATITVGFTDALPATAPWLVRVPGVVGSATLAPDGRSATYTTERPLQPERAYELQVEVCGEATTVPFQTLPPPVAPERLLGHVWLLDLGESDWLYPSVSSAFLPLLGLQSLLLTIREDTYGDLELLGRLAVRVAGKPLPVPCSPVMTLGTLDLASNPIVRTAPAAIDASWLGIDAQIDSAAITGQVGRDAGRLTRLRFEGTLDLRPVEQLTGMDDLCAIAETFGETCLPCGDGVRACLRTVIEHDAAEEVFSVDPLSSGFDPLGLCD